MEPEIFLDVDRVSKSFGRYTALSEVSFTLARGDILGFVGPNGAGKSTTLRILAGLLSADAGSVRLDQIDIRNDPRRFRMRIGTLIESPAFYPTLTAADHLAYVGRLRGAHERTRQLQTLRDVGLDPASRKPVGRFSLGMKQRLGIAMAILDAPPLLILDEPMNGLDPLGMADLRDFLRGLPARGISVLLSSHLLHEIEQICNRVLFIRSGRLLAGEALDRATSAGPEEVWLRTGDDRLAERVLREAGAVNAVEVRATGLLCQVDAGTVPRIAFLLVHAGITLFELTPRGSRLEDVYRAHYAGDRAKDIS